MYDIQIINSMGLIEQYSIIAYTMYDNEKYIIYTDFINDKNGNIRLFASKVDYNKLTRPNKNIEKEILDDFKKAYYRVNGSTPIVEIAHGGLECSSIMKRTNNMDIISIGSIIEDFHTVNERMYISSCEKTIKTLLEYLKS